MKKDIFLLDADDTILDFHGASNLGLRSVLQEFGYEWKDEYGAIYKRLNDSLWAKLERGELTREKLVEIRFPTYLELLGFTTVSGEKFNEKYLRYIAENPMFMQGGEDFLHKLPKFGRVYIVTNGSYVIQKSRFRIVEMDKYAEKIFISQEVGADKPSPVYTKFVLENIPDFDKARAVWIGDSLSADIKAACEAGIDSIWYNPKNKPHSGAFLPTFTANSFEEIEKILGIF